jgi:hypothetical protein
MFWVRTNDADYTAPFDYLTFITDRLYAGSYFHKSPPGMYLRIMATRNELQSVAITIPYIPILVLQIIHKIYRFRDRIFPFFTNPS